MKLRKNFYLDTSTIEYVEKFQDEHHISTFTAALTEIIEEHKHRNDISATKVLIDELSKGVAKELSAPLTRIRLGVNNADRNSDVIVLLLNTLLGYSPYKTFFADDTEQLKQAKQIVKDRIANYRQKKLDASHKKKLLEQENENKEPVYISEDDLV